MALLPHSMQVAGARTLSCAACSSTGRICAMYLAAPCGACSRMSSMTMTPMRRSPAVRPLPPSSCSANGAVDLKSACHLCVEVLGCVSEVVVKTLTLCNSSQQRQVLAGKCGQAGKTICMKQAARHH